jgi:hypothetical protein
MNTTSNIQPTKKLKLKKESIAVLSTPNGLRLTDGTFATTNTGVCSGGC